VRPGVLRRALVVVGCGALAVTASACESTESESARIGREGSAEKAADTLKLGAVNRGVRVSDVTLLSGGGRKAVAVKLTSTSSQAQREVPLLVNVTGAAGKLVYSNATGAELLLQRVTLLPAKTSLWWVDDEVLTTGAASAATVKVGTGRNVHASARASALSATAASAAQQTGSGTVSGLLANHTGKAQSSVPVFAVALRGGKVVAAGRAVVAAAPAAGAAVSFEIPLVGDAAGAKLELAALPGGGVASSGGLK
jgi:hypothetical protein